MQKKIICFFSILLISVICFFGYNQHMKNVAVKGVAENLRGMVFKDMEYHTFGELRLTDHKNNITYKFYAAKSTFLFNQDGTLTWTRQYDRSNKKNKWTEPVTTTLGYEVVYMGDFLCDEKFGIFLKLETDEILEVRFNDDAAVKAHIPSSINYNTLYDNNLCAPEELINIETSYVSTSSNYSLGTDSSWQSVCSNCNGTGRVVKSFGKTWSKKEGYGYGDVCAACNGTGKS